LPQLLQVGEIEQLAVTLLLTTKYPAEAVIPPRIRRRPAVLKKSFRFIVLFNFLFCGAWLAGFLNYSRGCTFVLLSSFYHQVIPIAIGTRGYFLSTLSELCFKMQFSISVLILDNYALDSLAQF